MSNETTSKLHSVNQVSNLLFNMQSSGSKSKRRGVTKMIVVGARVSRKFEELVTNPRGSQFRRVRERADGKVFESICSNKYKIELDNGTFREVHSNALKFEDQTAGIPPSEAVPIATYEPQNNNGTHSAANSSRNSSTTESSGGSSGSGLSSGSPYDPVVEDQTKDSEHI